MKIRTTEVHDKNEYWYGGERYRPMSCRFALIQTDSVIALYAVR